MGVTVKKITEGIPFKMGKGDTRRLFSPEMGATRITLNYAVFEPGQEFPQHQHDQSDDVMIILEGKGVVRLGGEYLPIEAGDVVHVPAGIVHGTINIGEGRLVIASCQAPPDQKLYTGERDSSQT